MHGLGIARPLRYLYSADLLDLQRSNLSNFLDKLFFKMKFKGCFISWYWSHTLLSKGGGGASFFRVIISFGLAEVAPYMTGTFGEVFGPWNHTGSEPRPARK